MKTEKKKNKVNPYLVGGVVVLGAILYAVSQPSAEEVAQGTEGIGSLKSRLKRIRQKLAPKAVVKKLASPLRGTLLPAENAADYYGDLYNHR